MMLEAFFGKKQIRTISPSEARRRLAAGSGVILLDVRSPEEYRELHIPNSISLPLDKLKTGAADIASSKSSEIIVYCQSGMRAAQACRQLTAMGYTNVSSLGGIQSWPYETERG